MKIKTITCHDVYNAGASLQAYALMRCLQELGHEVEIINYKPDYLSRHYDLFYVNNIRYQQILLRIPYISIKLPGRIKKIFSQKKRDFDAFSKTYLNLTKHYGSYRELLIDCPEADLFIAGSDQIWNTYFKNGFDPAFYLQFAPDNKVKVSYAASFAGSIENYHNDEKIKKWLMCLDRISIRESSALEILNNYQLTGVQVLDPVFLLKREWWNELILSNNKQRTIFINDFDKSKIIKQIALKLAKVYDAKIVSLTPLGYEDYLLKEDLGPKGFLSAINNSCCVVSNSFHATAFSLILHTDFYVVNRIEEINVRMHDLLKMFDLSSRLVNDVQFDISSIDWNLVDQIIDINRNKSMQYIYDVIELAKGRMI